MLVTLMTMSCVWVHQVETPPEIAKQVGRYVRQLDDDRLVERYAAERALVKLGPDALQYLPRATAGMSPEVKERLGRVRRALQTEYARRSVQASRVTLQGKMSLVDALRAFQEQTKNQIVGFEDLESQVDVDFEGVRFWEALDQVLDQADLTVFPFGGASRTITLVPRPEDQRKRHGRACYQGLFRFEATRISAVRDLRNPSIAGLRVRMAVTWEPRITPISLTQPLTEIRAKDDRDRDIPVDGGKGRLNAAVESNIPTVELELPFRLPQRDAKRIVSIQGTLIAMLPSRNEVFEFADLASTEKKQQRRAGVAVTLERVRKNDDDHEVHVRIRFDDAADALESHRGWILKNKAYVVDSSGQHLDHGGRRVTNRNDQEISIAYLFALEKPLGDYRFVYRTPSLLVRQPIAFELTDIELP